MTRDEAYNAIMDGKKVTHTYFLDNEFLEFKDGKMLTEDGYDFEDRFYELEYLKDGWSIYKE